MTLPVQEERAFYDAVYGRFLQAPLQELAIRPETFRADLDNPSKTVFERRRLYAMALDHLASLPLDGRRALEYGCGTGDWGLLMACMGAEVTLLDLSPVAVEVALRRARASGVEARVTGIARDASDLSCFADAGFDLIFAAFSLHHTLKHPESLAEIHRILSPGGTLMLVETYGNNRLLNAARVLRRFVTREPSGQGEGIILGEAEITALRASFRQVVVRPVNLFAMAKRAFRGRFGSPAVAAAMRALEGADAWTLRRFPGLARYCGEALVTAVK